MASAQAVATALKMLDAVPAWYRALEPKQLAARSAVYEIGLEELTDEQVAIAVRLALKRQGPFMPTPGELVSYVRPAESTSADVSRAAEEKYQQIVSWFERGGETLNFSRVEEWVGFSGAHAFMAAGGNAAFSWCEPGRDTAMRHKRFVDAYVGHEKASAAERAALNEGDALRLTRGDARRMLGGVVARVEKQGS